MAITGVLFLSALGLYLRATCLGCLGFRGDEDLTSLAVKAISQTGIPEFPSGMIYLRFLPYQYVLASSSSLLGFSEMSMRLPSALLGTLLIPLSYWFAARLFSRSVGLIVATGIALAFWEVEMSRAARMYAPFFVAFLGATAAIYVYYVEDTKRVFHWAPILLALLALSLHDLAYSLALVFLIPILFAPSDVRRNVSLFGQAALFGLIFLFFRRVQQHFFYLGATKWTDLTRIGVRNVDGTSAQAGSAGLLDVPSWELLYSINETSVVLVVIWVLISVSMIVYAARSGSRHSTLLGAIGGITATAASFHQFNIVFLGLIAGVFVCRSGLGAIAEKPLRGILLANIALFFLWMVVVVLIESGSLVAPQSALGLRKLVRAMFDFPNFRLFWGFVMERPILAVPLFAGAAWCLDRAARAVPDRPSLFVLLALLMPLTANALLQTKFEAFRYSLHLDTFYFCLVAVGVLKWRETLAALRPGSDLAAPRTSKAGSFSVLAALVVFLIGLNPVKTAVAVHRDYQNDELLNRVFGLTRYPDFKTTGEYVRARLESGDVVVTVDPREYHNYIGQVDYWIYTENYESQTYARGNTDYDLYLGIPVLHTLKDIAMTLDGLSGRRVWVLYSSARVDRTPWLSQDVKAWLGSLEEHARYIGRDGATHASLLTDLEALNLSKLPRARENRSDAGVPNE